MPAPSQRAYLRMKEINHSQEANKLGGESIETYLKIIPILIKEPYLTGKAVSGILAVPQGSIGKIMQAARKTLGITLNGDFVDLSEKFAECAVRLGYIAPPYTRFSRKYGAPAPDGSAPSSAVTPAVAGTPVSLFDDLKKLHAELSVIMRREGISSLEVTEKSLKVTRTKTITETFRM